MNTTSGPVRPWTTAACGLAIAILLAGCGGPPRRDGAPSPATAPTRVAPSQRDRVPLTEGPAPALSRRDVTLPAGCEVTDHTDTLAAYTLPMRDERVREGLGLLDLTSGRHATVLERPVNVSDAWSLFRPAISETWVAWEEVSPNEANAPRDAYWKLYAAPLDRSRLRIGRPRVVAEGWTDYKLRPHYGLVGSTMVWSESVVPSGNQEITAARGAVWSLDLAGGDRRQVLSVPAPISTLRVTGGAVVATERSRGAAGSLKTNVHILKAAGRGARSTTVIESPGALAHFVERAEGRLVWASFDAAGDMWPDLYLEHAGVPIRIRMDAIDPVSADDLLLFEAVASTMSAGGIRTQTYEIRGVRLSSMLTFRLLATRDRQGWWQTVPGGDATRTLVLANDLGPWVEDPRAAVTLVRVYRAPGPEART